MAQVQKLDDKTLLQFFIELRDRRTRRKADYALDDAGDKQKQDGIEIEFLRRFDDRGIDNVSSREFGTAYRSTRSSATVADRDMFTNYIKEHDAWELADIRVSKSGAVQFREEHDDLIPGTNWSETQVVNFRRT
tara:strand:- start:5610 stop:6011 length:402 start_codon:yes stop_codon:yes gene_type:complete